MSKMEATKSPMRMTKTVSRFALVQTRPIRRSKTATAALWLTLLMTLCAVATSKVSAQAQTGGSSNATTVSLLTTNGCLLYPTTNVRDTLHSILSLDLSLVQLKIGFKDGGVNGQGQARPRALNGGNDVTSQVVSRLEGDLHIFRPWLWQRTTSRQGRSLLMLSDNFDVLSLKLLAMRVETLEAALTQSPPGCLDNLTSEAVKRHLLALLLNDFKLDGQGKGSGSMSRDEHICYRQIRPGQDNVAEFVHVCCHYEILDPGIAEHLQGQGQWQVEAELVCKDIERDSWISLLLASVLVIKIFVVLFSPNLLPESLYMEKYDTVKYSYRFPDNQKMTLRMVKTQTPSLYSGYKDKVVRHWKPADTPCLGKQVDSWKEDQVYQVTLSKAQLGLKHRKILGENEVPVGVMKIIYNNLFLCRLRRLSSLKGCCSADILGLFNPGCTSLPTWYKCSRMVARIMMLTVVVLPWLIRILVYYDFERPIMEARRKAAARAGLEPPFLGSFTLYWTPVHMLFVVCYSILCVDAVLYGVLSPAVKEKMKLVIRRCLRDMRERSKVTVLGWATTMAILPCTKCGVLGLIIMPLWLVLVLPILLPVLLFYLFPAVNLSLRLLFHLVVFICPNRLMRGIRNVWRRVSHRDWAHVGSKPDPVASRLDENMDMKNDMSRWELPFQVVVVLMCLVSFWSLTFLAMELLSFLVEVAVYTFIGIIVTADVTSRYLTVLVMLILYAHGSFSDVHKKYLRYHQDLRKEVIKINRDEIDKVARIAEDNQENTAFYMHGDMGPKATKPPVALGVVKGRLRWMTNSLVLFLDNKDTAYTPEKFFFETIDLNYCGCPGKVYVNFLDALWTFGKLVIFLLFVFVVVMAFGSAHEVSSTNQLLATVAGGFIPLMFRFVFTGSSGSKGIDDKSIQWQTSFHTAVNEYTQCWPVFDIEPAAGEAGSQQPSGDLQQSSGHIFEAPPDYSDIEQTVKLTVAPSCPGSERHPLLPQTTTTTTLTTFPLPVSLSPPLSPSEGSDSAECEDAIDVIFDLSARAGVSTHAQAVANGSETMINGIDRPNSSAADDLFDDDDDDV